jgi:O-antigen ligase
MLISECIFFREGDQGSAARAFQGSFPTAAYGEVIMWGLCLIAIIACASRIPGFVHKLSAPDYKWMTLFALISVLSFVYAPRAALALVWGFKLCLIVLLLVLCGWEMDDFSKITAILRITFWAYLIVVIQPVIVAMMSGEMFDEEGRMSTIVSPNALSPNAGALLLMALMLYSVRKGEGLRRSAILIGLIACPIMILAGSKTGILAAVLAGGLFYLLRGKFGSAFGYIAITGMLVAALALATPLGDYFHTYEQGEGSESFSGRTILWSAVMPEIKAKPIIGHGYMATEFVMFQVNAVGWAAPQLHNGFLETLYNNGIIGFIPMLGVLIVIPVNLVRVLRRVRMEEYAHRIAAGSLSLYAFLVVNGCFNSSFGGKPTAPFLLLLGLVPVSQRLWEIAQRSPVKASPARQVLNPDYAYSVRS